MHPPQPRAYRLLRRKATRRYPKCVLTFNWNARCLRGGREKPGTSINSILSVSALCKGPHSKKLLLLFAGAHFELHAPINGVGGVVCARTDDGFLKAAAG